MGLRGSNERTPGDKTEQGVTTVSYLLIFVVFSCSIALAWSVPTRSDVSGLAAGLTAFALSGAAAAVGAGLGFLFGLPRLRDTPVGGESAIAIDPSTNAPKGAHYLTNSNLIKVSDWLTTIIIGLGLVNLAKVGPALGDLSNTLKKCLGGACYAGIVGVSVMTITLVTSIILCYLWTSLRVRELLEESENFLEGGTPSLIDKTIAQARATLGATPLKLAVGMEGVSEGATIIGQTPAPGAPASVGGTVTVTKTKDAI
jgi:hypothetical protein